MGFGVGSKVGLCFCSVGAMTDGMYNGKRYFHCPTGHGVLVKCTDIQPIAPIDAHPAVRGNKMYPSFKEIAKRRKQLAEKDPERDPARFIKGGKESAASFRLMQRLAKGLKVDMDENDVVYKVLESRLFLRTCHRVSKIAFVFSGREKAA